MTVGAFETTVGVLCFAVVVDVLLPVKATFPVAVGCTVVPAVCVVPGRSLDVGLASLLVIGVGDAVGAAEGVWLLFAPELQPTSVTAAREIESINTTTVDGQCSRVIQNASICLLSLEQGKRKP